MCNRHCISSHCAGPEPMTFLVVLVYILIFFLFFCGVYLKNIDWNQNKTIKSVVGSWLAQWLEKEWRTVYGTGARLENESNLLAPIHDLQANQILKKCKILTFFDNPQQSSWGLSKNLSILGFLYLICLYKYSCT